MKYQCVRCGKIKETKQVMLTCSGSCRVAYHRYLKAGNAPLDPIRIDDDVTPATSVLQTPPAHHEAESDEQDYVKVPRELYELLLYRLATMDTAEKKSDFTPSQTTFTPPTEKLTAVVAAETPEMIERRKAESIKNTLASLDEF